MSPGSSIDRVRDALEARDLLTTPTTGRCPAHEDRNASLSIAAGRDGRALVYCHAGCDVLDVLDALDLTWRDLFDGEAPKPWTNAGLRRTGAAPQHDGRVQLGGVAYLPGASNGDKARAVKGQPRDLWPDPASVPGATVYVVEGEPDAQTGAELGLPVVGVPGAGKWTAEFADRITAGRDRVVILPDADEPGRAAAARWATDLTARCPDVRIVDLHPGRDDGADLSTFAATATDDQERAEVADLIRAAAHCATRLTTGEDGQAGEPATALADRIAEARVDLVAIIEAGIPEREWLPASDRMLARGKRHHLAAQLKSGKTLSMLAHSVDMVIAGARVAILDRENGADEYARRLADILNDRPAQARDAVRDRLAYHSWPELRLSDREQLAAAFDGSDLVVFDSTRTFLSSLSLDEDRSDDYAQFAAAMVDPLFRAGTATVLLDNAGHNNQGRARGSSSKGDLADVVYTLKILTAFDQARAGRVRLVRAHSRFGDVGAAFTMELGAGKFGRFTLDVDDQAPGGFRPTHLMERTSRRLEETPGLSWSGVRSGVKGNNDAIDLGLELLVAEGYVRVEPDGQARRHYSVRPYREDDDPHTTTLPKPCPSPAQGRVDEDPAPCPPSKGRGRVREAQGNDHPAPSEPTLEALAARALADDQETNRAA